MSEQNEGTADESGEAGDSTNDVADEMQPMRFDIFVLSLNASALIHLGEAPQGHAPPASNIDLPLARQTIDILALLEEKTRGNLSGEEERLLNQVLFDLRMRFTRRASEL